jgi:hypothetical protein
VFHLTPLPHLLWASIATAARSAKPLISWSNSEPPSRIDIPLSSVRMIRPPTTTPGASPRRTRDGRLSDEYSGNAIQLEPSTHFGAVLAEQRDEWADSRCYVSLDALTKS